MKTITHDLKKYIVLLVVINVINQVVFAQGTSCAGAESITVNGSCDAATINDNSTTSDGYTCTGTIRREGWYTFTIAATTDITITGNAGDGNLALELISGACASLTQVACDNTTNSNGSDIETLTSTSLAAGTYFVKVYSLQNANMTLNSVCVTGVASGGGGGGGSNDLCAGAVAVTCGNNYSGTTVGATTTGETTLPGCGTAPSAAGVWYAYTGDGSTVTASLCGGASWDTKINVYSGSCASMTSCVTSNDDGCGVQSTVTFTASIGTTYYILVNGFSGATGAFTLGITCCTPGAPTCATSPSPANSASGLNTCSSLSWTAPVMGGCGSVDSYDVYFGTTNPPPFVTNTTATSYAPAMAGSTTYYWQIRPKNVSGTAAGCTVWSLATSAPTNPQYNMVDDAVSPAPYDCVNLTTTTNDQRGCAWDQNSTLNFGANFSYDFTVNLGSSDAGADGMAFVIQNDPLGRCKCGTTGGAIGAGGILNSVIVEIDTYLNTEDRDDFNTSFIGCGGSEDPDHLDIWLNGNVNPDLDFNCNATGAGERPATPTAVRLTNGGSNYNIENGSNHILRIAWASGSSTLTASVKNIALTTTYGTISTTFNPMTVFGTNTPYFGFTASTGGLNNSQSFCNPPSLLPVLLVSFNSYCYENYRKVYWSTASENNNAYFTLEKSIDGMDFETIETIPSNGTKTSATNYEFTDTDLSNKLVYYRLSQTDFNGNKKTFDVISSACANPENSLSIIRIEETAENYVSLEYNAATEVSHQLNILDITGKIIHTESLKTSKGTNSCQFDATLLSSGMYFFQLENSNERTVKKYLYQKR